jgi:ceramide glucosyltransferase
MIGTLSEGLFALSAITCLAACLYVVFSLVGIRRFRRRAPDQVPAGFAPPVTMLKPVCGLDFELYENLRSFCEQDYPCFQVVFAVRAPDDPAVAVIERIVAELPGRDIALVVDPRVHGPNLKVSNLVNAFSAAKHDILIISDSDMRVRPDYLASVSKPFGDPQVGVVTCLYRGVSAGNRLSDLACLQINEWFLPSVLVSGLMQGDRYCFGASMAVRREILARAGGLESLLNVLADDHMLGKVALDQGYRVELSSYVVDNVVKERSFSALFAHELRWARTVRILNPAGHSFSFLMNTISVALISAAVIGLTADIDPLEYALLALAVVLRLALHDVVSRALAVPRPAPYWMIPLRDLMSFMVWAASFLSRDVRWRGGHFYANRDGTMIQAETLETT